MLLEIDIVLEIDINHNFHDCEIRIDNGWIIKIGQGLDFYQKPASWYEIGANDLALRKCLETKWTFSVPLKMFKLGKIILFQVDDCPMPSIRDIA